MQAFLHFLLTGTVGLFFEFLSLVTVVGIISLAWRTRYIRRTFVAVARLIPAAVLFILGIFAFVLWKPVSFLTDLILGVFPLDLLSTKLVSIPQHFSSSLLITDNRRAYSERYWPPSTYPDLYSFTPEDIARPIYEDGRLFGGVGMTWLSDRNLTENALRSSIRAGLKAGVLSFLVIFVMLALSTISNLLAIFPALFSGDRPVIEQWPGDVPIRVSAFSAFIANVGPQIVALLKNLGALIVYIPATALISVAVTIVMSLFLLTQWLRQRAAPYEFVSKDADVRWHYRIESRNLLHETFRRQHAHATGYLKNSATFLVGNATGTLRARGDLSAPMPGQAIKLDQESLFQHVLVFGGTGEGKTSGLIKPLMKQVLTKQAGERKFGAFVSDAKGMLWRDAVGVAESLGRKDDIVIIGTAENDMGVNVVAGLTPSQIAATLRSVLAQLGTGGANSFWPDMASSVLRHMLTIGLGFSQTDAGITKTTEGLNPYSLWWPYQAILRAEVAAEAIEHIKAKHKSLIEQARAAPPDSDVRRSFFEQQKGFMTAELKDSIAYIEAAWVSMAKETKTGIIANVTQLLDGFGSSAVLRERFASGLDNNTVNLREALDGKLVLNALSSIEDGLPARLVSILIKTCLYREARLRETEFKAKKYSYTPQDRPCLVVMDEVQELATVDPSSGLSDASFWNVARSTGLAGVFATQTLSALTQAMGEHAAQNFIQQARSKVFFRTEEVGTVTYACWCAGQYERNRVFDDTHRESIEYRGLIDGWDPFAPVSVAAGVSANAQTFFMAARDLTREQGQFGGGVARPTYDVDMRFIATDATPGPSGGEAGNSAFMGSMQAAHWRAEDLTRDYRREGNELAPALTASDMIHMGRWHAFAHIQRAGSVRQDIVTIELAH